MINSCGVTLKSDTLECLTDVPPPHPQTRLLIIGVGFQPKLLKTEIFETVYLCGLFCDFAKETARLYCFV